MARCATIAVVLAALASPAVTAAAPHEVAALQVGLRAHGVYRGDIDGVAGPATVRALRAFQARAGLAVDGIAGPATRVALERDAHWSWKVAVL